MAGSRAARHSRLEWMGSEIEWRGIWERECARGHLRRSRQHSKTGNRHTHERHETSLRRATEIGTRIRLDLNWCPLSIGDRSLVSIVNFYTVKTEQ